MKNYFNQSAADTAKDLNVNVAVGLSDAEAQERSAKYGKNRLEGGKEKTILQMALEQLKDYMVIILIIAAIVSVILGETLEGVIIIAIVILNTFLGVYQENKASNALKALRKRWQVPMRRFFVTDRLSRWHPLMWCPAMLR